MAENEVWRSVDKGISFYILISGITDTSFLIIYKSK